MRLLRLKVHKYSRIMLNNITTLEYLPESDTQIIIGSNGSGKSSLMEEMTPLPGNHTDYFPGGYAIKEFEHKGAMYILTSNYDRGTGDHSFVKDGEELNKGGTPSAQRILVEQEFGLTKEVQELLLGITTFTSMGSAKRKDWLTKLSPVNLDYTFDLFNKVKTLVRDNHGTIKHLNERLNNNKNELLSEAELENLTKQLNGLVGKVEWLINKKNDIDKSKPTFHSTEEIIRTQISIKQKALAELKLYSKDNSIDYKGKESLEVLYGQVRDSLNKTNSKLEVFTSQLNDLEKSVPNQENELDEKTIESLRVKLNELKQVYNDSQIKFDSVKTCFHIPEVLSVSNPISYVNNVYKTLYGLLNQTHDLTYEQVKELDTLKKHRQKLLEACLWCDNQVISINGRLSRIKGCESVVCPNCTHDFIPGVDPNEPVQLEAKLKEIQDKKHNWEIKQTEAEEKIVKYEEFMDYLREFRSVFRDYPDLSQTWNQFMEFKVFDNPGGFIQDLTNWLTKFELRLKNNELLNQINQIASKLEYIDSIDLDMIKDVKQRKASLVEQINVHYDEAEDLRFKFKSIENILKDKGERINRIDNILNEFNEFMIKIKHSADINFQRAIEEEIKNTQIQIGTIQRKLAEAEIQERILEDIKKDYEEVVKKYTAYSNLRSGISGVISKHLLTFMEVIVKLLNTTINEIWTRPLTVLPSKFVKDNLDYLFPLNSNNSEHPVKDIDRGSRSQKQIIDFAFKLIVMKFLRLDGYPLFLDEFGSDFDEQHRQNVIPFLNNLLETDQIEQIFYISHFAEIHGAFNNADVMVLDSKNIVVPVKYNQHVVFNGD